MKLGFVLAAALTSGCYYGVAEPGDDWADDTGDGDVGDGDGDGDVDPPPPPLTLGDAYDVVSSWDLSSMIEDRALGVAARELIVETAVDALGVPSLVRDEAIDKVDDLVGQLIEDEVTDLAAGSQALADFRDDLGTAEIASEWTLDGETSGREVLRSLAVETNGIEFVAPLDQPEIVGALVLSGSDDARAVDTYELSLAAGEVLRPAGEAAVAAALESFGCDAIAELVVGADGELEIGISFISYTITAADVAGLCEDQLANLAGQLLGQLDFGLSIEIGGPITVIDTDGDSVADRITSREGYSGTLFGLPLPVAVSVEGSLQTQ